MRPLVVEPEAFEDFLKNVIFSSPDEYIIMKIAVYITLINIYNISNGFYGSSHTSGFRAYFMSKIGLIL